MEADVAGDGAVFPRGFVHFIMTRPGEVDARGSVVAVEATLNHAKDELGAIVGMELDVSGPSKSVNSASQGSLSVIRHFPIIGWFDVVMAWQQGALVVG